MSLTLTLLLLSTPLTVCDVEATPTPCERALAEEILVQRDVCAARLKEKEAVILELRETVLQPPPEPSSPMSLFGMPPWVTPAIAGLLLFSGVAIGVSL